MLLKLSLASRQKDTPMSLMHKMYISIKREWRQIMQVEQSFELIETRVISFQVGTALHEKIGKNLPMNSSHFVFALQLKSALKLDR